MRGGTCLDARCWAIGWVAVACGAGVGVVLGYKEVTFEDFEHRDACSTFQEQERGS